MTKNNALTFKSLSKSHFVLLLEKYCFNHPISNSYQTHQKLVSFYLRFFQICSHKQLQAIPLPNQNIINYMEKYMNKNDYLRTSDVCNILKISRTTLWRLIRDGHLLPRTKPGDTPGWLYSDIARYRCGMVYTNLKQLKVLTHTDD